MSGCSVVVCQNRLWSRSDRLRPLESNQCCGLRSDHANWRLLAECAMSVLKMASKHSASLKKEHNSEFEVVVSSLRRENDFLKNLLVESHHHYSTLTVLLERFFTLETVKPKAKSWNSLPAEQLSEAEDNQMDGVSMRIMRITSSRSQETEELKDKLVSTSNEQALTDDIRARQNNLKDALGKNKQWLEYDQQREACVRAILARMLWLEKQLNEADQACSQPHNEGHSDEKVQMSQMQEHYESLLQEANDELKALRYQFGETSQELYRIQNSFKEREREADELTQQRQTGKISKEGDIDGRSCSTEEEQRRAETEELRRRLDEEKRKSADLKLQEKVLGSVFKETYEADQLRIADLERQIRITSQDLEDERQDCLYLRKQIVKLLKELESSRGHLKKASKRKQQDFGVVPSPPTKDGLRSCPNGSLLDDSCQDCPLCQTQYPAYLAEI